MRRPFLPLLFTSLAACATRPAPAVVHRPPPVAQIAPFPADVSTPVARPPASSATETHAWPFSASTGAADWYTHDVWVVTDPPSAVFLLARLADAEGPDCEARLLAHARALGANRLYIDRMQPCAGAAYLVRDLPPSDTFSARAPYGAAPRSSDDIARWVQARWKRPASISEAEAQRLCVVVQFSVSPVRRVWSVRGQPIQSSGNRDFDESVRAALESAIDEHATVPAPPEGFGGSNVEYRVEVSGGGVCRRHLTD